MTPLIQEKSSNHGSVLALPNATWQKTGRWAQVAPEPTKTKSLRAADVRREARNRSLHERKPGHATQTVR